MNTEITTGTPVEFDSEHGPQQGTVTAIMPDPGNGRRIAVVQVKGTQSGAPWQVPVSELQAA